MFSGFAASPEDMVEKIVRGLKPGGKANLAGTETETGFSALKLLLSGYGCKKQQINSLRPERLFICCKEFNHAIKLYFRRF